MHFLFCVIQVQQKVIHKVFQSRQNFYGRKGGRGPFWAKKVPEWSLQVIFQGQSISSFCVSKCNKLLYTKCLKVGKIFMDEKGVEAPFGQ